MLAAEFLQGECQSSQGIGLLQHITDTALHDLDN